MGEINKSASDALTADQESIFDRVAAGEFTTEIAREYGVSPRTFRRWATATDEREKAYREAQAIAADDYARQGQRILEEAADTENSARAMVAKARADYAWRWASKLNRALYGDDQQANVNLNFDFGQLHLQALQSKGSMSLPAGRVEEAEWTEEDGLYQLERHDNGEV